MKRLLIISNNVLSETNNNGKTLLSFIKNFKDVEVSQLYFSGEIPRIKGYNYFQLADKDIIKGVIHPNKRGRSLDAIESNSFKDDFSIRKRMGRNDVTLLCRELLWFGRWKSKTLNEWLEYINPAYILFVAGDSVFAYSICSFIQKKYSCRLTVYVTDDYVMNRKQENLLHKAHRYSIKKALNKILKKTDSFYTISTPMQISYKELFGKDSFLAVNMTDDLKHDCKKKETDYIIIKQFFSNVKFDLVMYSTPPITFSRSVEYVKKRDGAKSYLLLKDIFPQNAVDLGMMTKSGIKGFIYKYFRSKEKKLYSLSDFIGCMSNANARYVVEHNPEVDPNKVEICPNSVEVINQSVDMETRKQVREKYNIPLDKKVFVYGGNIGKPQGIPFLIECLQKTENIIDAFFLIIGSGNDYEKLEKFVNQEKPKNVKLMSLLPKEDYDAMVGACDVGLIFLDHRFTIPNFPSRLLAYMQAKIPVLAVTDPSTDIGKVITDGGFGWWCESNDSNAFINEILRLCKLDLTVEKEKEFRYLQDNYSVINAYKTIEKHFLQSGVES